jgi:hypothetical protein
MCSQKLKAQALHILKALRVYFQNQETVRFFIARAKSYGRFPKVWQCSQHNNESAQSYVNNFYRAQYFELGSEIFTTSKQLTEKPSVKLSEI